MNKRIFREIRQNIGRYAALLLLTVIAVGMGVGFIAGTDSAENAYSDFLEQSCLEDAYITLESSLDNEIRSDIESLGIKVYDDFYSDQFYKEDVTVRLLNERAEVNTPYIAEGALPKESGEIFLDQLFASAQSIEVSDKMNIGGREYTVSGIGAFPDYTISLNDQTQMIADRASFGVAIISKDDFDTISSDKLMYNYALIYDDKDMDYTARKELLRSAVKNAACVAPIQNYGNLDEAFNKMSNASEISSYCGSDDNKRISPVIKKMESNKSMAIMFVGIVIVIIGFMYCVFIKHTIDKECSVIGTLMALGVKKKDILVSYILPPCLVTFIGSVLGCILGATVLYKLPITSLEGYYSIPTGDIKVSASILLTALSAPTILIILINTVAILRKLHIKPLRLIRKDLSKKSERTKSLFNSMSFDFRFRLRIFNQSIGTYIFMFIGIFLGGWLMIFGIGMSSSFDGYIEQQTDNAVCKNQYMISEPYEADNNDAEKATVGGFDYYNKALDQTYNLTGIGVAENSRYFPNVKNIGFGETVITSAASKKFGLKEGDSITLQNSSTGVSESYTIIGVVDYNMGLAVFMEQKEMNNIFRKFSDYYNYYFSDNDINIPDNILVSHISVSDMEKSGQIMKDVMKTMIVMFPVAAIIIYLIIMYLLIKMVYSKNETGISMMKIFGFKEKEIRRIFISTNTIVAVLLIFLSLPLQHMLMMAIWPSCIKTIGGYLDFIMTIKEYLIVIAAGLICYIITNILSYRHIKNIPMTIALKCQDR